MAELRKVEGLIQSLEKHFGKNVYTILIGLTIVTTLNFSALYQFDNNIYHGHLIVDLINSLSISIILLLITGILNIFAVVAFNDEDLIGEDRLIIEFTFVSALLYAAIVISLVYIFNGDYYDYLLLYTLASFAGLSYISSKNISTRLWWTNYLIIVLIYIIIRLIVKKYQEVILFHDSIIGS